MSKLKLSSDGFNAAASLRNDPAFQIFVEALGDATSKAMNEAINAPPDYNVPLCNYARALSDTYLTVKGAMEQLPMNKVAKPGKVEKVTADG